MTRSGSSLLEVLMGLSIVSLATVSLAGAISQGAREVHASADHMAALSLEQRFAEELLQDSQSSDTDALLTSLASGGAQALKDGAHPLFAALEDTAPPFGRLEPGRDVALAAPLAETYQHYGPFSARVASRDCGAGEIEADIELVSPLRAGEVRTFGLPLVLGLTVEAPVAPPPPDAALDDAIVALMYPGATGPLGLQVSRASGDLDAIRGLGLALVTLRAQGARADALETEVERVRATARATPDPELSLALGRLCERQAAITWTALVRIGPDVERLADTLVRAQVAGVATGTAARAQGELERAAGLPERFVAYTIDALAAYRDARDASSGDSTMRRESLDRRILELAEVLALADPPRGEPFLRSWLAFMGPTYRGRSRRLEALLRREASGAWPNDRLAALHPGLAARLASMRRAAARLPGLVARCGQELP